METNMKKYNITVNGTTYEVFVEEVDAQDGAPVSFASSAPAPAAHVAAPKPAAENASANGVKAPMPGTVLDIKVKAGQTVKKGDVILVLEAMKMENDIPAPCDGTVTSILVQKGASVASGDLLASLS